MLRLVLDVEMHGHEAKPLLDLLIKFFADKPTPGFKHIPIPELRSIEAHEPTDYALATVTVATTKKPTSGG